MDGNWLLSTVAQSAAAIVAIIGAFLVNALANQASQRGTLVNRIADLKRQVEWLGKEKARRDETLLNWDANAFLERVEPAVLDAMGELSLEDAIGEANSHREPAQLKPFYDNLAGNVRSMAATLRRDAGSTQAASGATVSMPPGDVDSFLNRHGEFREHRELLEKVHGRFLREWREKHPALAGMMAIAQGSILQSLVAAQAAPRRPYWENPAYRDLETESRDLAIRLAGVDNDLKFAEENLRAFPRPTGVWSGLAIMAGFAVLGVIFPIAAMPVEEGPLDSRLRYFVLGSFIVGLCSVLVYLATLAVRLGSRQSAAQRTEAKR